MATDVPVTFKAGDVVQLKSGGPAMIVAACRGQQWTFSCGPENGETVTVDSDSVPCMWFDGRDHIQEWFFPVSCLRRF